MKLIYGAILSRCECKKYTWLLQKLVLSIALLCVAVQVKESLVKITDKPIGTVQFFGENLENVSYSLAICYSSYFSNTPPMYLNGWNSSDGTWHRICSDKKCYRESKTFVLKQLSTNDTESCLTIPLNESFVRLEYKVSNKKVNKLPNIYIFQTGSIYSSYKLVIPPAQKYQQQKVILKNKIIKEIPSDDCWSLASNESYDECFVNFFKYGMNKSANCILKNMWYVC